MSLTWSGIYCTAYIWTNSLVSVIQIPASPPQTLNADYNNYKYLVVQTTKLSCDFVTTCMDEYIEILLKNCNKIVTYIKRYKSCSSILFNCQLQSCPP